MYVTVQALFLTMESPVTASNSLQMVPVINVGICQSMMVKSATMAIKRTMMDAAHNALSNPSSCVLL